MLSSAQVIILLGFASVIMNCQYIGVYSDNQCSTIIGGAVLATGCTSFAGYGARYECVSNVVNQAGYLARDCTGSILSTMQLANATCIQPFNTKYYTKGTCSAILASPPAIGAKLSYYPSSGCNSTTFLDVTYVGFQNCIGLFGSNKFAKISACSSTSSNSIEVCTDNLCTTGCQTVTNSGCHNYDVQLQFYTKITACYNAAPATSKKNSSSSVSIFSAAVLLVVMAVAATFM